MMLWKATDLREFYGASWSREMMRALLEQDNLRVKGQVASELVDRQAG
jgi:hypothetical protein